MEAENTITVRRATSHDRLAVLSLIPELRSFGQPLMRDEASLDQAEARTLNKYFDAPAPGSRLWVAAASGRVVGAAYAETHTDYFTREAHGHVGILTVASSAQGQGVGAALLATVEEWAKECRFRFLTLNVFAQNERARHFYEHAGFTPDIVRYLKPLMRS